MSNTKALTPGTFCKPKDEKEWRAVLDLADSLGLGGLLEDRERMIYTLVGLISDGLVRGVHSDAVHDVVFWTNPLPVPDFIAGMYALAEKRKEERQQAIIMKPFVDMAEKVLGIKNGDTNQLVGTAQIEVTDLRKALDKMMNHKTNKQRFEALEASVSKLEQALNNHMVKERHLTIAEQAIYNTMVKGREKE